MAKASRLSIQVTSLGFMERLPLTGQTKSVWSLNFVGEFFTGAICYPSFNSNRCGVLPVKRGEFKGERPSHKQRTETETGVSWVVFGVVCGAVEFAPGPNPREHWRQTGKEKGPSNSGL